MVTRLFEIKQTVQNSFSIGEELQPLDGAQHKQYNHSSFLHTELYNTEILSTQLSRVTLKAYSPFCKILINATLLQKEKMCI